MRMSKDKEWSCLEGDTEEYVSVVKFNKKLSHQLTSVNTTTKKIQTVSLYNKKNGGNKTKQAVA